MKKYAIIVAGGTGTRMKGDVPKQFMLLIGKPVIFYSIEAFHAFDPDLVIILVVHADYITLFDRLVAESDTSIRFRVVPGGETRFDSVKKGLALIQDEGLVAIHDAARPSITPDFIRSLFFEASIYGSAIPVLPVSDTIRMIDGDTSHQFDRTYLRAVQTPQIFKVSELQSAYTQSFQPLFTDDGSVMEAAGFPIHLAEGRTENIKITHIQDIAVAEVLMKV